MAKKQTKANKAFIEKIKSIGINVSGSKQSMPPKCPGCGDPLQKVGEMSGDMGGTEVHGDVYAYGPIPMSMIPPHLRPPRQRQERKSKSEQSFSA